MNRERNPSIAESTGESTAEGVALEGRYLFREGYEDDPRLEERDEDYGIRSYIPEDEAHDEDDEFKPWRRERRKRSGPLDEE